MMHPSRFLKELKRRHVFRVAVVYAVVAAGTWQVADVAFAALDLPDVALKVVVVLAIAGFPLALVLAWAFEVSPDGVREEQPLEASGVGVEEEPGASVREDPDGSGGAEEAAPLGGPHQETASVKTALDQEAGAEPERPDSVAVLPFVNMSGSAEDEYFCDGMTEELIHALAKVQGLNVAARTSSFAYKGKQEDVREIGRALSVGTVLEGSVRRAGARLRVAVQLVGVEDGYHLWSETFDREMEDVFAIQDEIAEAVVGTLKGRLAEGRSGPLVRRGTRSVSAYEGYLKGRYCWNRRTEEGLRTSITHFREAIDEDPTYVQAYAGLADSYVLLGIAEYGMAPPDEVMPRAKAAARKALEIDSGSAEAQTTLAHVTYAYDWEWEEADRAFRRAIELDPEYAFSHHWYALFLSAMGRHDEAVAEELRAREMEPLSLIINKNVGTILFYAGRLDEALTEYRKALELEPTFTRTHYYYGLALEATGELEEALNEFRIAVDSDPTNTVLRASLGHALGLAGEVREAEAALRGLERMAEEGRYVPALNRAMVLLGMQRHDEALAWLERALEERSSWLVSARVDPTFDSVRDHPRFQELLERVGLP